MNLSEIRQQYPQYQDLSDDELAGALHRKFYPDMDKADFDQRIGLATEPERGILDYIDYGIRNIADAATFGLADRAAAYVNPRINKALGLVDEVPEYEEALEQERERTEEAPGIVKYPSQVAGGVGTALLAAPAVVGGATKLGLTALPRMAQFTGLGAVEGALHGAGHARRGEELSDALKGAAIGGAVGAAAPAVVGGVSGLFGRIKNALTGQPSINARAARDLGRAIQRDAMTPDDLASSARQMAQTRPGTATLADAGGENVKGLVERVAQTPGAGRTQVVPSLTQKQQQQALRIGQDLRSLTGTQKTAYQAAQETIAQRAGAAKPLYDEAFNFNARASGEIVEAWQKETATGYGASVLKSGKLRKNLQTEYGIADPNDAPLMMLIDAWKKQVDDLIGKAKKAGAGNEVRILKQMQQRILNVVDEANPAYATARNAWAGPTAYLEAIEEGRNILSRNLSGEEWRAAFNAATDSQKDGMRLGAVNTIIARMGNDPAKLGDMTKYLRSDAMKEKIAAMMPSEELAQSWAQRLDFEVEASELTGRALRGSQTARRLAEQDAAEDIVSDLVIDALSGGSNVGFLRRVLMAGPKWLRDTVRSKADAELADILTNPGRMNDLDQVLRQAAIQSTPTNGALTGTALTGAMPLAQ